MQMTLTNACLRWLRTALSTTLLLALALPWPAFADTAGMPGDGIASVGRVTTLVFGDSPPVLSLPGSIAVEATSPSGASVSFTATASDANPVTPTLACSPTSGSTFPLGTTVVTCSATGASGITSHGSFTVRVQDTRPPSIAEPTDITQEATGPSGAPVTYPGPTATDVGGPVSPTVTCTPASGSTFPLGTTVVKCSAADAAGNAASTTFNVTVVETTPAALTGPPEGSHPL